MRSSTASNGLSASQVKRYLSARQRFLNTSTAATNGTSTTSTTSGVTGLGAKPASTLSIGTTRSINDEFLERLAKLATTPRGPDSAPLTTYTTTSTEHGEIYKASREYVDWLRRKVPGYGVESSVSRPTPHRSTGGEGKEPTLNPVQF